MGFGHPRRDTYGRDMVGDIFNDDRTGADDHAPADPNPLNNAHSDPDMAQLAHMDIPCQMSPRGDVNIVPDYTIMIDGRTGVDDRVLADPAP
jgi:hypothetical protein